MISRFVKLTGLLVVIISLALILPGCDMADNNEEISKEPDPHGMIITVNVPEGLMGVQGDVGVLTIEENITAEKIRVELRKDEDGEAVYYDEIEKGSNSIGGEYDVTLSDVDAGEYFVKAELYGRITRDDNGDDGEAKVLYKGFYEDDNDEAAKVPVKPDSIVDDINVKVIPLDAVSLEVTLEDSKGNNILYELIEARLKHPSEEDDEGDWNNENNSILFDKGYKPARWHLELELVEEYKWLAPIEVLLLPTEEKEIDIIIDSFDLTFEVRDEEGDSLVDAEIVLEGIDIKNTDSDGEAKFENLLPDTYEYLVNKEGYEMASGEVEIVDSDVTETITLEKETYNLNIDKLGDGEVQVDGSDIEEFPFDNEYEHGKEVKLEAEADEGYEFFVWTGSVEDINEDEEEITITMDEDKSLTANFVEEEPEEDDYFLFLDKIGQGNIEVDGDVVELPYREGFEDGDEFSLKAIPDECSRFVKWFGDVNNEEDTEDEITIKMDDHRAITAEFAPQAARIEFVIFTNDTLTFQVFCPADNPYDGTADDALSLREKDDSGLDKDANVEYDSFDWEPNISEEGLATITYKGLNITGSPRWVEGVVFETDDGKVNIEVDIRVIPGANRIQDVRTSS